MDCKALAELSVEQVLAKAKSHMKKGEFAEAQSRYVSILKVFPNNKKAQKGLASLGVRQQSGAEQGPPQAVIDQLVSLYNQGQLELVIGQTQDLTAQFPKAITLWNMLGASAAQIGQFDQAVRAFEQIIILNPNQASAHFNMGNALKDQGKVEEAIVSYNNALSIKPDYEAALNNVVVALKSQGETGEKRLKKVLEIYNEAQAVQTDNANSYFSRALDLQIKGMLDEAIDAYKKALAIKPDYAEAYINMAIALIKKGKLDEALEACNEALVIKPNYSDAYYNMGNVLKEQGKLEEAIEAYNKALALKPDYADAYYNMGNILKEQEKLEEAIEAYNKALAIKPDYAEAYNNMGAALKEQAKLEEAIEAYNKSLAIKPDYAEAYNNMGLTLKDQGKPEEAIEAFNKALAIKPDFAEAIENSQSLAIQLLTSISKFGYEFYKTDTQANSKIMLRPKYQIQNAIKAFLEADFRESKLHNNNFKACDQNLLDKLQLHDKVFCSAYSCFLDKLLENNCKKIVGSETEKKVYHLGESHCLSYAHQSITIDGSNFRIAPRITFGAKAFHLSRRKDDSFKAITKTNFASLPKCSKVFLSFGEIDCRPNEGFITAARKLDKPLVNLIADTVRGYVQWFLEQNEGQNHCLYFINVPAPHYEEKHSPDLNYEVARAVALFNAALKKYTLQHSCDLVDVFKFTVGKEGFSNGLFHVDSAHLGAKAIPELEQQLI